MILIISPKEDIHTRCVAQDLSTLGQGFRIVDSSRLADEARLSFNAGQDSCTTWTSVDGEHVALEEVKVVWHRRRFMPAAPLLADQRDMAFVRREWEEFFSGVFSSMDASFVNPPAAQVAAVKPLQLRLAARAGMRIPDTLITNDPVKARAFVEKHQGQVIHKTHSQPRHRWLGTVKWESTDDDLLENLVLAPTIFQEIVSDCRELRITVVGDELFAAEFRPPDGLIDGRLASYADYRKHSLPEDVREHLLRLVKSLGLIFCTVDMKLTDEGEYVFLELNPQGQFLYVEVLTGMPLSMSLARLLSQAARGQVIPGEARYALTS